MNPIGIMQGRLSPPVDGKIQAFPAATWRQEFLLASDCGLDWIEWIIEEPFASNPLIAEPAAIAREIRRYGVQVRTVCADYFMQHPFTGVSVDTRQRRLRDLEVLLDRASSLGIQAVVLPCVDNAAVRGPEDEAALAAVLEQSIPRAEAAGIRLLLETSLGPSEFKRLLDKFGGAVGVNYDTGNSASLGYEAAAEFAAYGALVETVHIKDRVRGGGTVPLGHGAVNFGEVFSALGVQRYAGPFILQVARQGDEVEAAKRNRDYVVARIREHALRT